jgi:signal transduction histidine kinase
MSHELRTPLNAIIGFSDLIREEGATNPAETAEYAGQIARAGRRLLEVASDVLDMSQLEAGSLVLEKRRLPIGEVLEIAVQSTAAQFAAKDQPVDVRL